MLVYSCYFVCLRFVQSVPKFWAQNDFKKLIRVNLVVLNVLVKGILFVNFYFELFYIKQRTVVTEYWSLDIHFSVCNHIKSSFARVSWIKVRYFCKFRTKNRTIYRHITSEKNFKLDHVIKCKVALWIDSSILNITLILIGKSKIRFYLTLKLFFIKWGGPHLILGCP